MRIHRLREIGRLPSEASLPREDLADSDVRSEGASTGRGAVIYSQRVFDLESLRGQKRRKEQGGHPRRTRRGRFRDRLLLVLEIGALLSLTAVLIFSLFNLKSLNEEYAQASQVPLPATTTPTPLAGGILPDEHAPPDKPGGVPSHLRDLVGGASLPSVPFPTPGPEAPTRIVVPAIGVDALVVEGDSWEQLKLGVGHRLNTANPGERGNMVLSAHNDIYGEIFRDLDDLELGDEVIVYDGKQPYHYTVTAKKIVEPTEVSVLAPTTQPVVTLISCYPYMVDTHRIVVVAELR